MIIFDVNNEILGEYDLLFKQKTKGMHHFITCETKDTKQLVYVNMLTGEIMMN